MHNFLICSSSSSHSVNDSQFIFKVEKKGERLDSSPKKNQQRSFKKEGDIKVGGAMKGLEKLDEQAQLRAKVEKMLGKMTKRMNDIKATLSEKLQREPTHREVDDEFLSEQIRIETEELTFDDRQNLSKLNNAVFGDYVDGSLQLIIKNGVFGYLIYREPEKIRDLNPEEAEALKTRVSEMLNKKTLLYQEMRSKCVAGTDENVAFWEYIYKSSQIFEQYLSPSDVVQLANFKGRIFGGESDGDMQMNVIDAKKLQFYPKGEKAPDDVSSKLMEHEDIVRGALGYIELSDYDSSVALTDIILDYMEAHGQTVSDKANTLADILFEATEGYIRRNEHAQNVMKTKNFSIAAVCLEMPGGIFDWKKQQIKTPADKKAYDQLTNKLAPILQRAEEQNVNALR